MPADFERPLMQGNISSSGRGAATVSSKLLHFPERKEGTIAIDTGYPRLSGFGAVSGKSTSLILTRFARTGAGAGDIMAPSPLRALI